MGGFEQAQPRAGGNGRRRARAVADAEYPIEVTLAEAFKGAERLLEVRGDDGKTKRLTVKIPAGVRDGQRIRLAGQAGGGDLYLQVKVKPHPLFTRDGDDLRLDLPVALHEALLGAEVTPETQNGRTIRLAGQGMPRSGGGAGDLYVTVKVVLPTKLSDSERDGVREIAERRKHDDVRAHLL